jgi:iron-sulfur cluster repair protein YtfE (RIC family)
MTAIAPTTPLFAETAALDAVVVDIYRDVHKGIRHELFGVTLDAGRVDPGDAQAVSGVATRWTNLVGLLVAHADHEETFVQPVIKEFTPLYAEEIAETHARLESQMAQLELLADRASESCPEQRRGLTHRLYLGLASFTAAYLEHQEFEEFEVMVMLSEHVSPEDLRALDNAIVASLSPEMMGQSLSIMVPAMNIEDQAELFGGMQAGAPPEVFAGAMGLAQSVLEPARYETLARRLGV